jgi:hypothetical protein
MQDRRIIPTLSEIPALAPTGRVRQMVFPMPDISIVKETQI